MMRWLIVLFCFVMVSASVNVDSYDIGGDYVFSDKIHGEVNLTIEDESSDGLISLSDGRGISLIDFLEKNNAYFECLPTDCSNGYSFSSGSLSKSVEIPSGGEKYVGFVLNGGEIVLDSISFNVSSDFGMGEEPPLSIEFFEDDSYVFSNSSNDFLSKNWGCFSAENKKVGPLIGNSFYCEVIDVGNTDVLRVGADVSGSDGDLDMAVYPEEGFGSWECSFDPDAESGCIVYPSEGESFTDGAYWVCVGSDRLTSYNIYEDVIGENCGFSYSDGAGSSVKDYGIFAQGLKYADSSVLEGMSFSADVDSANSIISKKYSGSCSEGCILPLKISGVPQNFDIHDVNLVYMDNSEWKSDNLVYGLERIPAKIDFNGSLDLGLLDMEVLEDGEYFARFSGEYFFKEDINLLPAPVIRSVIPLDPPVAVPVVYYVDIDFDSNESLDYEWDFGGDESIVYTEVPYVSYTYDELGNHTLSVRVSASGNLSSKKSFAIDAISPKRAIVEGLASRKNALAGVREDVTRLSSWYEPALLKFLKVAEHEDELARLEREYNNSVDVKDFVDIAVKLYALNVPILVRANNFKSSFLMTELDDIDVGPIVTISGSVNRGEDDSYSDAILLWQEENIDVVMKNKDIFVKYWNGEEKNVLNSYSFDVISKWDRESFFVIGKPFGDLYFNGDSLARKTDDSTVIVIDAGASKSFEFYYMDESRGKFFVSPALSSLVIEENIDTDCNFNLICEEENGETSESCRSDCKPTVKAFLIFILLLILLLIIYTILQIWYKRHYEKYLFKDRVELYNLLMYISNARARGMKDNRIAAELRSKGWASEKVKYGMRKSLGKNIGMVEIVPIEKISARVRDWKARRMIKKALKAAKRAQDVNKKDVASAGVRPGFRR